MVRIVRTGRTIRRIAKGGRVLSGSDFNTIEDAKRLEKQYLKDEKAGHTVVVGMKRGYYLPKGHKDSLR
jgi:hypothetical protein